MAITEEKAGSMLPAAPVETVDMAGLLTAAYELGDMIINSADAADYEYWKNEVAGNQPVQELVRQFAKAKELFEECQRFGRFHPDFHAAKDKVKEIEGQLAEYECVRNFKAAEKALDDLLYDVSHVIARAVSEEIKVPANEGKGGGGCGSGGSCGCGSGGCG
ncbi:YlbF family regulator [Paenibacillus tarimensis]|uniref:YlbF family regulator n=1 Tax=Paenibacillus tarimensis TaxID=416012 RepID=UPI001F2ADA63|nr:YlbF family regulator [Paenibacillus tarimensis]MCF2942207.1 YlbF family regulator [Paenibacillus tarimensis]